MKKKSKKEKVYFGQDELKNKNDKTSQNDVSRNERDKNKKKNDDDFFSPKGIYAILKQAGHSLRLDDILRRAQVTRRSKKEVLSILEELIDDGKVIRQRGAAYTVSESLKNIQGRVAIQRSGAAFVTPQKENGENGQGGKSTGEDIYIPPNAVGDAWNGDLVEVVVMPNSNPNRGGTQKREGRITQVIERGQSEFVIRLEQDAPKPHLKYIQHIAPHGYVGRPTDSRFSFRVIIPDDVVLSEGAQSDEMQSVGIQSTVMQHVDIKDKRKTSKKLKNNDENASQDEGHGSTPKVVQKSSAKAPKKSALREGDLVVIKIGERLPSRDDNPLWLGTALRKLGEQDKVSVQEEVTKLGHGIPTHFPDDLLAEAKSIAESEGFYHTDDDVEALKNDVKIKMGEYDVDLRAIPLVTIDGADSRDFDDAVFVEKTGDNWRLVVAIADVSRYVLPFGKLDNEARLRGNSYYFPSSVEPMLPEALSNGLCSLRPHEDHRVMFADMLFDKAGICQKSSFGQGIMRSKARLTYEAVQELYEKGSAKDAPFAENMSEEVNAMLIEARKLANILIERRRNAGSLHLEIPEPKCVTKDNKIVELATRPHFFAHELIEAFMVSANEAVAEFLSSKQAPCLYRVHPAPAPERLESLNVALQTTAIAEVLPTETPQKMGANNWLSQVLYKLEELKNNATKNDVANKKSNSKKSSDDTYHSSAHPDNTHSGNAQNSTQSHDDLEDQLEANIGKNTYLAHRLILRSMMQARYSPALEGHFGLASQCYCHFTSPIRRYADLMVHRSLKETLGITKKETKIFSADAFLSTADICNERERIAQAAEREIYRRLACLLLESEVGKEFDAVVSGLSNFGLFAEMSSNMAEGMIRMENLGDDYFIYDEEAQTLYGQQSGVMYRLGDAIRVELINVDLSRLEITLSLVGATPRRKGQNFRSDSRASTRSGGKFGEKSRGNSEGRGSDRKRDDRNRSGDRDKKSFVRKESRSQNNSDNRRDSGQGIKPANTNPSRNNEDAQEQKVHRPKKPKQRDLAKNSNADGTKPKRKKKKDHKPRSND